MTDLRTDDDLARALREIADWPTAEPGFVELAPTEPATARRPMMAVAAALVLVAALAGWLAARQGDAVDAAAGVWTPMASSPLSPRFAPATVWTGEELLVVGGYDQRGDEFVDGAAYDPSTDRWRRIAPLPGDREQRSGAGVGVAGMARTFIFDGVWIGHEAVFMVGGVGPELWDFDVVAYDPAGDAWRTVTSSRFAQLPSDELVPVAGEPEIHEVYGITVHEEQLLVYGWRSDLGDFGWSLLDPASGVWSAFAAIEGSGTLYFIPPALGSPTVIQGRYLVLIRDLGSHLGPFGYVADLDTGTSQAIEYPPTPPSDLEGTSFHGAMNDEGLYVGAALLQDGDDTFFEGVAFRFDPGSATWAPEATVGPAWNDDSIPTLVATPNGDVAIGGIAIDYGVRNDPEAVAAVLPVGEDRWRPLPEAPIDISRLDHTVVWTGEEVLVWGGATVDPQGSVNAAVVAVDDGARFRPE